jgi:hypothetical protein
MMSPSVLQNEDDQQAHNHRQEKENTLHRSPNFVRFFGPFQLLDSRLGMLDDCLHVVVNPIQNGPLINDQNS